MCFDKWYKIKDQKTHTHINTYTFVQKKNKIATTQSITFKSVLMMSDSADKNNLVAQKLLKYITNDNDI